MVDGPGVDLARVFAEHFGYTVKGNWIHDPEDRPVGCGWEHFADRLTVKGWIRLGSGVDWRRAGERPRLPRVARIARGHWV